MRMTFALAFAALLVGAFAQPAAADTYLGGNGVVGPNRLRDASDSPGVTCTYVPTESTDTRYEGRLRVLKVRPPIARAAYGQQDIGWRFIVDRTRAENGVQTETTTYASPWQVARTTASRNAQFSPMKVLVKVPRDGAAYAYTVRVDILWDAIGEPTGESIRRADYYLHKYSAYPFDPFVDVEGSCIGVFVAMRVTP